MYLSAVDHYDIVIIGAGLAGLTAAIHLGQNGHGVLVIEKQIFPHHKVCGEYVSNEVRPYLESLGVDLSKLGSVKIESFQLTTSHNRSLSIDLPMGGFGISRFAFDNYLYEKAVSLGVLFKFQSAVSIKYSEDIFTVKTSENEQITSKFVIGSFGKRSNLDKFLNRRFAQQKSPWLAIKQYYECSSFPDNLVALHNFKGGYGGLSKNEKGTVNFCYLVTYKSFQTENCVADFNQNVIRKNPYLDDFLSKSTPVFKEPLSIAQISFEPKELVKNHVLMCGDAAGLIHPLCGNGMAMAIHSAKVVSELIHDYIRFGGINRYQLERDYKKIWKTTFGKRLWTGRRLQSVLLNDRLANLGMSVLAKSPALIRGLIKNTHGKPIE